MAHSITQHPPSALAFPSAPRPSALGFGFGGPARSPLASVSFGQWSQHPNPFGTPATPSGSASPSAFAHAASPVKPQPPLAHRPSPYATPRHASSPNLKRSRRSSSPTLSSSPSPTISPALPPGAGSKRGVPSLGGLALDDARGRRVKKVRAGIEHKVPQQSADADVDVGMMLASLPPNAHLQIILNMIKADPSLSASVLSHMPVPDIGSCVAELDKAVERITRQYDPNGRRELVWARCAGGVVEFCRLATSYMSFFYSPPAHAPPTELQTLHTLIYTITRHILTLLRIAPHSVDSSDTTLALSNLANAVLGKWTAWVDALVAGVKQGDMFPHSTVTAWVDNLSQLVDASPSSSGGEAQHVLAFASALKPARERFEAEVGWLTGPRKW